MTDEIHTGGCQCGAVRYSIGTLGRATICHCRMCQKAFGSFFGPLVTAYDLVWTRGEPKHFASSNRVRRGFCGQCGTPLSYEFGGAPEIAIGTLDNPESAEPVLQVNLNDQLSFFRKLHALPSRTDEPGGAVATFLASIVSHQHPDHDTETWTPGEPT
jgi:hypothetical protein